MTNPQTGELILVDRTEVTADDYGSYLKIYAMDGKTHRISEKRSALWDLFRNARQWTPVLAIYETYQKATYIADAKPVTHALLAGAITHMGQKVVDKGATERNRSQSVSYAKDLVVGGKVPLEDLIGQAQSIYDYITDRALSDMPTDDVVVEG